MTIEEYKATGMYNTMQLFQLECGVNRGLDVRIYDNPEFSFDQMRLIKEGLQLGLDVTQYANPQYSYSQMCEIKDKLKHASGYANSVIVW